MKLSEAIMLGQGLVKFDSSVFLEDGRGCLIGAGYAAVSGRNNACLFEMAEQWPWLNERVRVPEALRSYGLSRFESCELVISYLAFKVRDRILTVEQAVDIIRSIEPEDLPPPVEFVAISPSVEVEVTRVAQ